MNTVSIVGQLVSWGSVVADTQVLFSSMVKCVKPVHNMAKLLPKVTLNLFYNSHLLCYVGGLCNGFCKICFSPVCGMNLNTRQAFTGH